MFTRRAAISLCSVFLFAGLVSGPAQAAPSVRKAIWGPTHYAGKSQFPIYRDLGVGIYQQVLDWSAVAPTRPANPQDPNDPAYQWPSDLDFGVHESVRYGIRPLLLVQRSPAWATGGQATIAPPLDPQDYADFMQAAAKRYPAVHYWMVWGEPIRNQQYLVTGRPNDQQRFAAAFSAEQRLQDRRYAELVDAAYGRLKALNRRNLVIGGNTTTSGDVDPWNWIKNLRLADGRPPRMDMYGHNPFSTRRPDLSQGQLVKGTADFSDLDLLARWLDRYLARSGRNHKLPIFISEYNSPTDRAGFEFNYHVTRRLQASWLRSAFSIERRWKRIYTLGWQPLRDFPARSSDGMSSRTGLIDLHGVRKPAYAVFKHG